MARPRPLAPPVMIAVLPASVKFGKVGRNSVFDVCKCLLPKLVFHDSDKRKHRIVALENMAGRARGVPILVPKEKENCV